MLCENRSGGPSSERNGNMLYYVPIIVVVAANTLYHVAAKGMPAGVNTFALLIWVYLTAALLSLALFFVTSHDNDLLAQMKAVNPAPFILGTAIVGLEFGFILLYKVGWDISVGSTICGILLALVLLFVGIFFYKDDISVYKIAGILLCAAGLFFINRS